MVVKTQKREQVGSDLFLSYSRADRPLAEQFVRTAAARGVNVWYDEDIEGGRDWRERIVAALGSAKALVILFSEHSDDSRQLIKELAVADNMRKQVIPVLVSNCEPKGPYLYELASRNWIPIYPNPETKLAWLIDKLVTEQEPRGVGLLSAVPAPGDNHSWSPLRRYDLYILVPILVGGFLISLFSTGDNKDWGLGIECDCIFHIHDHLRRSKCQIEPKRALGQIFSLLFCLVGDRRVTGPSHRRIRGREDLNLWRANHTFVAHRCDRQRGASVPAQDVPAVYFPQQDREVAGKLSWG